VASLTRGARNRHLLGPDEDHWVGQRIARGVHRAQRDNWDHYGPNGTTQGRARTADVRAAQISRKDGSASADDAGSQPRDGRWPPGSKPLPV
jgi:hypothetical protein